MDKATKGFAIAASLVLIGAGIPLAITGWRNLLTDKRPYEERFEDCRVRIFEKWVKTYRPPGDPRTSEYKKKLEKAGSKTFDDATNECRSKIKL